jgi:hypothetical protein
MEFTRLDNAIAVCKQHLAETGLEESEIASYLVGYLIVIISAEYECAIEAMINMRAARTGDSHIMSFVEMAASKIIRSVEVDQLTGFLGHFDVQCKEAFKADQAKQAAQAQYGNIIINRHNVAHATGTNMTFKELEAAYAESKKILDCFGKCLGLRPDEMDELNW